MESKCYVASNVNTLALLLSLTINVDTIRMTERSPSRRPNALLRRGRLRQYPCPTLVYLFVLPSGRFVLPRL